MLIGRHPDLSRTGLAPITFGAVLLALAVGFADGAAPLSELIPIGTSARC